VHSGVLGQVAGSQDSGCGVSDEQVSDNNSKQLAFLWKIYYVAVAARAFKGGQF